MTEMTASRKNGMPPDPRSYKIVLLADKIDLIPRYLISSLKCNQLVTTPRILLFTL